MTRGTEDGSAAEDYNTTGEDYLDSGAAFTADGYGYITKHMFTEDGGMFVSTFAGSNTSYYTDQGSVFTDTNYAFRGGYCNYDLNAGTFCCNLNYAASRARWNIGAAPSCKPLS